MEYLISKYMKINDSMTQKLKIHLFLFRDKSANNSEYLGGTDCKRLRLHTKCDRTVEQQQQ